MTYLLLRADQPELSERRSAARTLMRVTPAAAPSLAPGGRKCVRLTEVLLFYASAERGPSGRRGPWLRTLGSSGGWRRRRDPEGLRRWFGFWSGKVEEFRRQRIPGDLWWQSGLVEPAAARPKCGSFMFPGGRWDLGL